ncbi:MAG: hypothetical protein ACKVVT_14325 [Dehalococcoidia bacterium]
MRRATKREVVARFAVLASGLLAPCPRAASVATGVANPENTSVASADGARDATATFPEAINAEGSSKLISDGRLRTKSSPRGSQPANESVGENARSEWSGSRCTARDMNAIWP